MPLYDYVCEHCGEEFERLLPLPGDDTIECPRCDGIAKRVITRVNIAFYRSNMRTPGVIGPEGQELNLKKQDVFGRYFDDLPDNLEKERYFHRWKERFKNKYKRNPPAMLARDKMLDALHGIDISKEF